MTGTYKKYAPALQVAAVETLGQIGGQDDLEDDIALCAAQTIEPVFREWLPRGQKILEAGCGRGRWVFHLRRLGFDVTGIDIARTELDAAKRHDPAVPVLYEDILRTSFADGEFGALISLGVVEHFEAGPQPALAEARRLLRPDGIMLVTVPTQSLVRRLVLHPLKDVQQAIRWLRGQALAFEEYRYDRRHFESLLRGAGFQILEVHADDFLPPHNIGLYADAGFLQHPTRRWELNAVGNALNRALWAVSPWLHCSGTLWVCRRI